MKDNQEEEIEKLAEQAIPYGVFEGDIKRAIWIAGYKASRENSFTEPDMIGFANFIGDRPLPEYSKSTNKWRWWRNEKREYQFASTEELFKEYIESNQNNMEDTDKPAMQERCIHCGKEQYAPAVYSFSLGDSGCVWCGKKSEVMNVEEYKLKLAELKNEK